MQLENERDKAGPILLSINFINLEFYQEYHHCRVFFTKSPVKHYNNSHNTHNKRIPNRWPAMLLYKGILFVATTRTKLISEVLLIP